MELEQLRRRYPGAPVGEVKQALAGRGHHEAGGWIEDRLIGVVERETGADAATCRIALERHGWDLNRAWQDVARAQEVEAEQETPAEHLCRTLADPAELVRQLGMRVMARPRHLHGRHERNLLLAARLHARVLTGGFDYFLLVASGDESLDCLEALMNVGATRAAQLLVRAMEVSRAFPLPSGQLREASGRIITHPWLPDPRLRAVQTAQASELVGDDQIAAALGELDARYRVIASETVAAIAEYARRHADRFV